MAEKKIEVIRRRTVVTESEISTDIVREEIRRILEAILKVSLSSPLLSSVTIIKGEQTTIFEIDIHQLDFGRLVGGQGKSIGALRSIVINMSGAHGFRSIVRIKDEHRFY